MRLIDADALPVCKEHYIDECGFGANFYVVHKTDIDASPTITIEAEPVKHGRWDDDCRCTNCTWYAPFDCEGNVVYSLHCPNCGCKMDLEDEG